MLMGITHHPNGKGSHVNQLESLLCEIAQNAYGVLIRKGIPIPSAQDCVQTAVEKLLSTHTKVLDAPKFAIQKWVNVTALRGYLTWLRDNPEVLLPGGPNMSDDEATATSIESDLWHDDRRFQDDLERRDLVRYVNSLMRRLTIDCLLSERQCVFASSCQRDLRCTLLQWIDADEAGYEALAEAIQIPVSTLHRWHGDCVEKFIKLKSADDVVAEGKVRLDVKA
jgi:hypothetical protein